MYGLDVSELVERHYDGGKIRTYFCNVVNFDIRHDRRRTARCQKGLSTLKALTGSEMAVVVKNAYEELL